MGGRDNITVVMFRLAGDDEQGGEAVGEETVVGLPAPLEADTDEVAAAAPPSEPAPPPRPKRRRRRVTFKRVLVTLLVLSVLAGLTLGAAAGLRHVYFVGQDDHGLVALYRGVPYELPLGINLYDKVYVSSVPARSLSAQQRRRILDHELRSRSDAADIVRRLEGGDE